MCRPSSDWDVRAVVDDSAVRRRYGSLSSVAADIRPLSTPPRIFGRSALDTTEESIAAVAALKAMGPQRTCLRNAAAIGRKPL